MTNETKTKAWWKKITNRHYAMYAPNGQAQVNRWLNRDGNWSLPLVEITTAVDELTKDMAAELRDDINWLLNESKTKKDLPI